MKTKASSNSLVGRYYQLTKPGIIYGNVLTGTGGFLLAAKWHIDVALLMSTLVGMALVIGGACVFNNYIDRGIDQKMARTQKRALAAGVIPGRHALIFASVLTIVGLALLLFGSLPLVALIGLIGFIDYVILYGWSKRKSTLGTVIGSISGSAPVLAGYVAARGHIDLGGWLVFLIMVFWQMPHFFGIALYRQKDYAAAGIPVLPVKKGAFATKVQILLYVVGFILSSIALSVFKYAGYSFAVVLGVLGVIWFVRGVQGFKVDNDEIWGKKMFLFSLIIVLVFSVMLPLSVLLP